MLAEAGLLLVPLAAGLLVLLTHLPLGEQVLKRGILFIDLAVAQLAALGALLAQQGWPEVPWAALAGGTLLAVLGAGLVGWLAARYPAQREAVIGLLYAGAACSLLLLLASDPHAGHQLARSLNGDILWVSWDDLLPLALLTVAFWAVQWRYSNWLGAAGFYPCFALLVSFSVPLLGVYLVFVTLIAPALVAQLAGGRSAALLCGCVGYLLGLGLAWQLDWPAGATLVLSLLLASVIWVVLYGLRAGYSSGQSSASSGSS
jgi:zinc/manganese transport system permease protein